jgi:hypothetical protein
MAGEAPGVFAPEEVPVAEATPVPEPTAGQVETPEGDQPEAKPERTFTQKEVDEITAKRAAQAERRGAKIARAEAERDYYKSLVEKSQQAQTPPARDGKPREEDFQGKPYSEYVEALADWKAEQKLTGFRKESEEQQRQRYAQEQAREFGSRLAKGAEKYSDFKEVALSEDVPITQAMAHAIGKLGNGADVAYYLGSNRDEAEAIAAMSDVEQVWAMKDISSKITSKPTPTKTSAPIVPSGAKVSVQKEPEDMTYAEFCAFRKRQIAQRR